MEWLEHVQFLLDSFERRRDEAREAGEPNLSSAFNESRSAVYYMFEEMLRLEADVVLYGLRSSLNSSILRMKNSFQKVLKSACSIPDDGSEEDLIANIVLIRKLMVLNSLTTSLRREAMSSRQYSVAYAVVVSAVVLLSFVYQYLVGYVDKGGSKAYSSGALEFRDTYVSIVLFQGAYVWVKFRDVASKGVYCRPIKGKLGRITHKYEPRFKPPREKTLGSRKSQIYNWIYLGQFDTCSEAEVLYRIAAFYYGKDEGRLDLGEGRSFTIPLMSKEEQSLFGMEKVEWVKVQAKRVHKDFEKEKAAARSSLPPTLPGPEWKDDAELLQQLLAPCGDDMSNFRDDSLGSVTCAPPLSCQVACDVLTHDEHERFALPESHSHSFQERPVPRLVLDRDSALNFNTSDQVDFIQTLANNQQQLINLQQQQLQAFRLRNLELQHQIMTLLQQQHLQQQMEEFNVQNLKLPRENGANSMKQQHGSSWPHSTPSYVI